MIAIHREAQECIEDKCYFWDMEKNSFGEAVK